MLLVIITISLLFKCIKSAKTSDLTSFNSLLILAIYVFKFAMILLMLSELLSIITYSIDSSLVIILIFGLFFFILFKIL